MTPTERALITASLTSTMAYLATDGLSAMTDYQIETIRHWQSKRKLITQQSAPKVISNIRNLITARWELTCECNAMLAAPDIDFDIFDISNEDAHNSMLYRHQAAGNPYFGFAYEAPTDYIDRWLDDEHNHGIWDAPAHRMPELEQACRDGACDGECRY